MFGGKNKKGDEESQRKLESMFTWEDIKVVIAMVILVTIALLVVLVNYLVMFKEVTKHVHLKIRKYQNLQQPDQSVTTFRPLEQQKKSNMKITGVGYIP